MVIILLILLSAAFSAYESFYRFLNPQPVEFLGAVALASIGGFIGNELVSRFRIKIGNEIGSAALIADGYHAREDGFTSLAVLFGVIGVWLGYPIADPLIGLLITIAILRIVWDAGKSIFLRILDGIDPQIVDEIYEIASTVKDVVEVTEIRVRWLGHRLYAEINIAVDSDLSFKEGHEIAIEVRHRLLHGLKYLSNATIHVDPSGLSGETYQ